MPSIDCFLLLLSFELLYTACAETDAWYMVHFELMFCFALRINIYCVLRVHKQTCDTGFTLSCSVLRVDRHRCDPGYTLICCVLRVHRGVILGTLWVAVYYVYINRGVILGTLRAAVYYVCVKWWVVHGARWAAKYHICIITVCVLTRARVCVRARVRAWVCVGRDGEEVEWSVVVHLLT